MKAGVSECSEAWRCVDDERQTRGELVDELTNVELDVVVVPTQHIRHVTDRRHPRPAPLHDHNDDERDAVRLLQLLYPRRRNDRTDTLCCVLAQR